MSNLLVSRKNGTVIIACRKCGTTEKVAEGVGRASCSKCGEYVTLKALDLVEVAGLEVEYVQGRIVTRAHRWDVDDRVWLLTDPKRELGTIKDIIGGKYLVAWDSGRTWLYPGADLLSEVAA